MTTQEQKAMELALEALETLHDENMDYLVRNKLGGENNQCMVFARDVIKSIKRTLAQPEQEPVECQYAKDVAMPEYKCVGKCQYAPPQRKPLTKDQMYSAIRPLFKTDALAEAALSISFDEYRAIEAAHGIKE